MLVVAGVGGAGISVKTYGKFVAIRKIQNAGGSVHMCPRPSDDVDSTIEDDWMGVFADVDMIYFGVIDNFTDDCLAEIAPELRTLGPIELLVLDSTDVTDAGLSHLKEMTGLKILALANSRVTDAGVADLKRALPQLSINRY